ncbi:MAG TPA: hypothetical protein VM753_19185 [Anaeromyxobacter sp.]|jgi:hypothetical protein|nr:hypothetical protein [Anaeromyxobacter sp.]
MSIRRLGRVGVSALVLAAAACGSSSKKQEAPAVTSPTPPVTPVQRIRGNWTYYDVGQGLSQDIQDVSVDEGGNVYVAGGDAVYVKKKGDDQFLRFDAKNAGLTENCNDLAFIDPNCRTTTTTPCNPQYPPTPPYLCRVISVAGAAPGKAIIGLRGFSQLEGDIGYMYGQFAWALTTGGADVVAFDADKGALTRTRHVRIASPPHIICKADGTERPANGTCSDPNDPWWNHGRALVRRIERIAVNHDSSSPMYGDVWLGGNHAVFSVLLANASARGYANPALNYLPEFNDAIDVWEHVHPAVSPSGSGLFVDGEGYALSIDPRNGTVWGSNEFRTAYVTGYGPNLANDLWWMGPLDASVVNDQPSWYIDVWPDPKTPTNVADPTYGTRFYGPTRDDVRSVSHCPDGTVWVGSTTHGLARIDAVTSAVSYVVSYVDVPDAAHLGGVTTVACDPKDGSVWIGRGLRDWSSPDDFVITGGGLQRYTNGQFATVDTKGVPAFANNPVNSIQIDPWSSPRVLYFAFHPVVDASGKITAEGGVASYDGD